MITTVKTLCGSCRTDTWEDIRDVDGYGYRGEAKVANKYLNMSNPFL